jgi:Tol biopolymer transport system component
VLPFSLPEDVFPGWGGMRDGKAIAFIGQDEKGVRGVYVQDFNPGQNTAKTRRALGGSDPELTAESWALSPDGRRLVVASRAQLLTLMLGEEMPDVSPPKRPGR